MFEQTDVKSCQDSSERARIKLGHVEKAAHLQSYRTASVVAIVCSEKRTVSLSVHLFSDQAGLV